MKQQVVNYTNDDHERWQILFNRLQGYMHLFVPEYKKGLEVLQLSSSSVPSFNDINDKLTPLTGWQYKPMEGDMSYYEFLKSLANRVFHSATQVRSRQEMNFCKLPDIFHDVFGHSGLLVCPEVATFLEQLGQIGLNHEDNPEFILRLLNIYWYTAEVGLIQRNGHILCYGGSIISSVNEIERVYSGEVKILPYNLERIMETPYNSFEVNDQYFVISGFDELTKSLDKIKQMGKLEMKIQ